jgi:hypothetical protein
MDLLNYHWSVYYSVLNGGERMVSLTVSWMDFLIVFPLVSVTDQRLELALADWMQ